MDYRRDKYAYNSHHRKDRSQCGHLQAGYSSLHPLQGLHRYAYLFDDHAEYDQHRADRGHDPADRDDDSPCRAVKAVQPFDKRLQMGHHSFYDRHQCLSDGDHQAFKCRFQKRQLAVQVVQHCGRLLRRGSSRAFELRSEFRRLICGGSAHFVVALQAVRCEDSVQLGVPLFFCHSRGRRLQVRKDIAQASCFAFLIVGRDPQFIEGRRGLICGRIEVCHRPVQHCRSFRSCDVLLGQAQQCDLGLLGALPVSSRGGGRS